MPLSRIRFLSTLLGGLLSCSNAILTLRTMNSALVSHESTWLCKIWCVDKNTVCMMQYAHNKAICMWLTVHGSVNGCMTQPGVASSKISNVSFSFSNSNITSLSCFASLKYLFKDCANNSHKGDYSEHFYWIIHLFTI